MQLEVWQPLSDQLPRTLGGVKFFCSYTFSWCYRR